MNEEIIHAFKNNISDIQIKLAELPLNINKAIKDLIE